MNLKSEYERLLDIIAEDGPIAVAFSGGADSSLLLKATLDVFGTQTPAFFANSILQTQADIDNAIDTADRIGANVLVVEILPFAWSEFTSNPPDRCYHCKKKIYSKFKDLLPNSVMVLADGSNLDDLGQERPGHRAIDELDVLRPLVQAGLGKVNIRELGKFAGVPSWDRDSASCLATRIPTGLEITRKKLQSVAAYEEILIKAGFTGCRVRMDGDDERTVKIEVKKDDLKVIAESKTSKIIAAEFRELGICNIHLEKNGRP